LEHWELLNTAGRNAKWYSHFGKQFDRFLTKSNIHVLCKDIYNHEMKTSFIMTPNCKQPKYPLTAGELINKLWQWILPKNSKELLIYATKWVNPKHHKQNKQKDQYPSWTQAQKPLTKLVYPKHMVSERRQVTKQERGWGVRVPVWETD
jgi:hypothetical protein